MSITTRAPVTTPRPPQADKARRPVARKITDATLTLLAGFLYVIGWASGTLLWPVWFAVLWLVAALRVGWDDGSATWREP